MLYLWYVLLIWNILVMLIYGVDKLLAKLQKRRISEAMLLSCAFLLGGLGAMFGMILFNHKTAKPKFRILVPLFALLGMFAVVWLQNALALEGLYVGNH